MATESHEVTTRNNQSVPGRHLYHNPGPSAALAPRVRSAPSQPCTREAHGAHTVRVWALSQLKSLITTELLPWARHRAVRDTEGSCTQPLWETWCSMARVRESSSRAAWGSIGAQRQTDHRQRKGSIEEAESGKDLWMEEIFFNREGGSHSRRGCLVAGGYAVG